MKTKPKFVIGDSVQTVTAPGRVTETLEFADHFEHLVQFADGTASWLHEAKLSPPPQSNPPNPK